MGMRYKKGDKVVLLSERPSAWSDSGRMDVFLGGTFTIHAISSGRDVYFAEPETHQWGFRKTDIVGFADPNLQTIREAEHEKILEKYCIDHETIKSIAIEIFGEERVDSDVNSKENFSLKIHFPELVITNSKNDVHTIKDIYVKFNININDIYEVHKVGISFDGARATVSLKEFISTYGHSHLPNICLCNYRGFCLGSSEFGIVINSLCLEPTPENWYLLLFSLENYLIWESLEGGPYRKIAAMGYNISNDFGPANAEFFKLLPNVPTEVFEYNTEVRLNENHPLLYQHYSDNSTVRDTGITRERIKALLDSKQNEVRNTRMVFKGQIIRAKIYDEEVVENVDGTLPITADIINYYNRLLKEELQKFNLNYGYESAKTLRCQTVFG
jgi:hypothetical protein